MRVTVSRVVLRVKSEFLGGRASSCGAERSRSLACDAPEALSLRLRTHTASSHARIESLLGLPRAVQDINDYCRLLERFLGLYEPLERLIHEFDEWESVGLPLAAAVHSSRLSNDLSVLGTDLNRVLRAPPAIVPDLPTFSHALGACYVLEGSALGGRVIMRDLADSVKQRIEGATSFLSGRDSKIEPTWNSFRAALDSFGRTKPNLCVDVIVGAERVFEALLTWFGSARDVAVERR
jgi:heme oxygenase